MMSDHNTFPASCPPKMRRYSNRGASRHRFLCRLQAACLDLSTCDNASNLSASRRCKLSRSIDNSLDRIRISAASDPIHHDCADSYLSFVGLFSRFTLNERRQKHAVVRSQCSSLVRFLFRLRCLFLLLFLCGSFFFRLQSRRFRFLARFYLLNRLSVIDFKINLDIFLRHISGLSAVIDRNPVRRDFLILAETDLLFIHDLILCTFFQQIINRSIC